MLQMTRKARKGAGASCQHVVVIAALTLLNVSFFGFSIMPTTIKCSTDLVLQSVSGFLYRNGATPLEDLVPDICSRPSDSVVRDLQNSVRNLVLHCSNLTSQRKHLKEQRKPLITLFTTFADHMHSSSEKISVHNNTIINWSKLKPYVNMLLLANDTQSLHNAKAFGWDVVPLADEDKRPPVLKDMFLTAMKLFDTPWYGFVNADILFTGGLLDTVLAITQVRNTSDRILLTGRRTNVEQISRLNASDYLNLTLSAKMYGSLYREDAEDFFIATKSFPWREILPLVIGRPGYDNWLVREARCALKTEVVDVTNTVLAVHQTTVAGGNNEGHMAPLSNYNVDLIKSNNITPNYLGGLTDCIPNYTFFDLCDHIHVSQRTHFGPRCNCNWK